MAILQTACADEGAIMKIIIEVKDTATLSRIEQLSRALDAMQHQGKSVELQPRYDDVIKSISKEW